MEDKEIIYDLMTTEKNISSLLNTFASECVNTQLKDLLLDMLDTTQTTQYKAFDVMQKLGYYQVKNATSDQIKQVSKKFVKEKFVS